MPKATKTELALTKELKSLSKEIRKLKDQDFMQVFNNPWKFMGFSLLKGIAVGFGSVLGASVVVALFVYLLSQISFVPFVGEFVNEIIGQIETHTEVEVPAADPAPEEAPLEEPTAETDQP